MLSKSLSYQFTMRRRIIVSWIALVVTLVAPLAHSFSAVDFRCNSPPSGSPEHYGTPTSLFMTATVGATSGTQSATSTSSSRSVQTTSGKVGKWEFLHGNWVLRPSSSDDTPRAVLHFLGGALVGASPHITYRYLLERLAEKGFLIIATPYQLSFDHLQSCDEVITKFEKMAPSIARQYGAIPVVGIGHSCGALLQLLITSLFPDTPRAGNALLSFNNKPVSDAVPFFEEVFAPFFTTLATQNATRTATSNDLLKLYLQMAKSATEGMSKCVEGGLKF